MGYHVFFSMSVNFGYAFQHYIVSLKTFQELRKKYIHGEETKQKGHKSVT